jgi:hypothetical protein
MLTAFVFYVLYLFNCFVSDDDRDDRQQFDKSSHVGKMAKKGLYKNIACAIYSNIYSI